MSLQERHARYAVQLRQWGQEHLLAYWHELDDARRSVLLDDLDQIDFARCAPLIDPFVRNRPRIDLPHQIQPSPILPAQPDAPRADLYARAGASGVAAIRGGRVAAFTVAGGQGTRLGYDGPKGGFPASVIRNAPLFRLFAECLLGCQRRYGHRPRWYVMTSPSNHAQTLALFEAHAFFGLRADEVVFFPQAQMPAFRPDGRIALAEKHRVSLSPDGHGGSLQALARSGALADMQARGIEQISYFQVDNPLARPIDPLFIGLHIERQSEMSSKAVTKAADTERVGNFCLADGKLTVIEYSDLPTELALQKNLDGTRRFDAGSIAIHILDRRFVERLTSGDGTCRLPWHRADKAVALLEADGRVVTPRAPNAVKLEMFVFDALPLARNPLVLYTPRAEEFSPIKNADGVDSPATARRDLLRRDARWLEAAGVRIPRDAAGEPACPIEITPRFALDESDLREQLILRPTLRPGEPCLLDRPE